MDIGAERRDIRASDLWTIRIEHSVSISGAEEKVLRAFSATKNFAHNYRRLIGLELASEDEISRLPEGASVAALGLSNKAVYEADLKSRDDFTQGDNPKDNQEDFYFRPVELMSPPNEETLAQNTLWSEIRKLYGHGYDTRIDDHRSQHDTRPPFAY